MLKTISISLRNLLTLFLSRMNITNELISAFNNVFMYVYVHIFVFEFVCVCLSFFFLHIPPQSSSGTLQHADESLPSGWIHQPPAVCHLSYAQTQISSQLAASTCKWFESVLADGLVNKSENHSCSLKHKACRPSEATHRIRI